MVPLRKIFRRMTLRAEITAVLCLVTWTALTGGYVSWQISQSQHHFCSLLRTLTLPPPPGSPPQIPRGRLIAQNLADLKASLGC
jgi:hypothetical protein